MFSESELRKINDMLSNGNRPEKFAAYKYKKQTEAERERNKYRTLVMLESLRSKQKKYSPEEILDLRLKRNRIRMGLDEFEGIYLIHNTTLNKFYIGKSENVFTRVHDHFRKGSGSSEVYDDYISEMDFTVSTINLEDTPFNDLNELEDNAIRAYRCREPYGYNKEIGKIIDEDMFSLDEHKELSHLFIGKMKDDEEFYTLKKTISCIFIFLSFVMKTISLIIIF
ncbi:GIY-YIG nuclease family protein [Niallia circulans]